VHIAADAAIMYGASTPSTPSVSEFYGTSTLLFYLSVSVSIFLLHMPTAQTVVYNRLCKRWPHHVNKGNKKTIIIIMLLRKKCRVQRIVRISASLLGSWDTINAKMKLTRKSV